MCLHGIATIRGRMQKMKTLKHYIFLNFHVSAWNRQYKGQSAKNKHFKNWNFFPNFHGSAWNRQYKGQSAKKKQTSFF